MFLCVTCIKNINYRCIIIYIPFQIWSQEIYWTQSETDSMFWFFSFSQEVILKRAADLVEALYGLPHNNQVRCARSHIHRRTQTNINEESHKEVEGVTLAYSNYSFCRRSFWNVRQTSRKHSTAFHEDTPSSPAPPTVAWWGSTPSPGSCPSTSQNPHRAIRVRLWSV